jgi:hypothetical protein
MTSKIKPTTKSSLLYILLFLVSLSIVVIVERFLFSGSFTANGDEFKNLIFKKSESTTVFNLLTTLWFIAWLVESFLEIIIKIFQIDEDKTNIESSTIAVGTAAIGFAIGLIIAWSGIRTLSMFFSIENYSNTQKLVFGCVDAILTASVIAGGSKAIHELTNAYKGVMRTIQEGTPNKANEQSNTGDNL